MYRSVLTGSSVHGHLEVDAEKYRDGLRVLSVESKGMGLGTLRGISGEI